MRAAEQERNARNGTGRLTKACEICGTEFSYYASVRPQAAYCSRSCKSIGHKLTGRILYGKNSPSTFRKAIRVKFLDRCAICGWDEAPCDVCHIVARKHGGENAYDNVLMLCPNHHRLFDCGRIPVDAVLAARPNCLPGG
jgi:5-methylcytosine-specific restriction endonuclease McrA